jgi:hypothetical protein
MKARLALVLLAACTVDADPATVPAYGLCSSSFCGGNSPIVGHYGINDQLNLDHVQNADGFTVLGMSIGDEWYQLDVADSRFLAWDAGGNKVSGPDLRSAKIWLDHKGRQYGISIEGVDTVHEVVAPGNPVETYLLEWGDLAGATLPGPMSPGSRHDVPTWIPAGPVCPEPISEPSYTPPGLGEWDEPTIAGMHFYDAVVFEGDRIHADSLTIDPTPDNRWFNIGCGAHMLAKLRLTRTTINFAAGWQIVQSTMKMLGGDYCGMGTRLTVHGEPLVWVNYDTMPTYLGTPQTLEARWGTYGAFCLGDPRLAKTDSADARAQFPDIHQAIADECARQGVAVPPPCNEPDPWRQEYWRELVTSANWNY